MLYEIYCVDKNDTFESYTCPNGCKDGACIVSAQPSITVNSPNSGESFTTGRVVPILWQSANAPVAAVVDLSYSSCLDGTCASSWIQQGLNQIGSYDWMANIEPGQWYVKADLRSQSGIGGYTLMQKTVTVNIAPSSQPSITVTSPNGGENWTSGTQQTITWVASNLPTNGVLGVALVNVDTSGQLGLSTYLTDNLQISNRSWTQNIPTNLVQGSYKVKVFCHISGQDTPCGGINNPNSYDTSDNYFNITSTEPANITVSKVPDKSTTA